MSQNQTQRLTLDDFRKLAESGKAVAGECVIAKGGPGLVRAIGDPSNRIREFVLSDASIDRDSDTIAPDGWELDNYAKNPVALWAHQNTQPPIGVAKRTEVVNGKLVWEVEFTPADMPHGSLGIGFGAAIMRMYDEGFLRGTSAGFIPKEWVFVDDRGGWFPMDIKRQELLEGSMVPVPSNPNALHQARAKGIDVDPLVHWAEELRDTGTLWIPKSIVTQLLESSSGEKTPMVPGAELDVAHPDETPKADENAGDDVDSDEGEDRPVDVLEKSIQAATDAESKILAQLARIIEGITKRGRVLSQANEDLIREAHEALGTVLSKLDADKGDDEDEDDEDEHKSVVDIANQLRDDDTEEGVSADEIKSIVETAFANKLTALTGRLPE